MSFNDGGVILTNYKRTSRKMRTKDEVGEVKNCENEEDEGEEGIDDDDDEEEEGDDDNDDYKTCTFPIAVDFVSTLQR